MNHWLFKEEPTHYSFADLERDGETVWDGIANNLALKHLRQVKQGDQILYYHTGDERAIVAIAEAASDAFPDPNEDDPKLVAIRVKPVRRLAKPVTLAQLKADKEFAEWELLRISRLSVMPVPSKLWKRISKLAEST